MSLTMPVLAQAGGGDLLATFLPIVAIMAIFYFLMIRPQQKKMKEHKAMVEALAKGDVLSIAEMLVRKDEESIFKESFVNEVELVISH